MSTYIPTSQLSEERKIKRREGSKKHYYKNRENIIVKAKKYREKDHDSFRKKHIFHGITSRCKKNNIDFNLKFEDLHFPELCPILGIPLFFKKQKKCDNTPSVDRIDPKKGYTKDNVIIISFKANRIKNNATKEEINLICDWMNKNT